MTFSFIRMLSGFIPLSPSCLAGAMEKRPGWAAISGFRIVNDHNTDLEEHGLAVRESATGIFSIIAENSEGTGILITGASSRHRLKRNILQGNGTGLRVETPSLRTNVWANTMTNKRQ